MVDRPVELGVALGNLNRIGLANGQDDTLSADPERQGIVDVQEQFERQQPDQQRHHALQETHAAF